MRRAVIIGALKHAASSAYTLTPKICDTGKPTMAYIELCIRLDCDLKRAVPEVRAWVDVDPDGQHAREIELALECRRATEWFGAFAVAEGGPCCVLYRVALVAHAGAEWSLSMHERSRTRALLVDRDTLAMAKGWLVGTCELARAEAPAVWLRPRHALHLHALQSPAAAREPATVAHLDRMRRR
jgi:hypothetical protein